mmetsp:Transcript_177859/g.570459  ORF Transcript_177859/g.570459 Transcript_177859/m.570459 type:complete len:257 (+) Transcript_177859:343-1113(+)
MDHRRAHAVPRGGLHVLANVGVAVDARLRHGESVRGSIADTARPAARAYVVSARRGKDIRFRIREGECDANVQDALRHGYPRAGVAAVDSGHLWGGACRRRRRPRRGCRRGRGGWRSRGRPDGRPLGTRGQGRRPLRTRRQHPLRPQEYAASALGPRGPAVLAVLRRLRPCCDEHRHQPLDHGIGVLRHRLRAGFEPRCGRLLAGRVALHGRHLRTDPLRHVAHGLRIPHLGAARDLGAHALCRGCAAMAAALVLR